MTQIQTDKKHYRQAPWERHLTHIVTPIDEFIHKETSGGMLLMLFTVIALVWANSPFAEHYQHLLHTHLDIHLGSWKLEYSLHHWVNDGLMVLFFFVVGLEIKREVLVGELSSLQKAAMPIIAAIGGMVVPALLFLAFNQTDALAQRGWGIPMATDIAFAVGVLVLLGDRVPKSLLTFLLALAIVDDLGAVLVIAVFYTEQLSVPALGIALGIFILLMILNRLGVRRFGPYLILGVFMWLAMLKSGVHATLAGVLTALTIPVRSHLKERGFLAHMQELTASFNKHKQAEKANPKDRHHNANKRGTLAAMEANIHAVASPAQRLENMLHITVVFMILPIFALFNAGIPLPLDGLAQTLSAPITLGVLGGLVLGKVLGIAFSCMIAVKLGLGQYPSGTRATHLIGVGFLGGIGFTMSIFISELAFIGQAENLLQAKTGVLFASLFAGILGYAWLRWFSGERKS